MPCSALFADFDLNDCFSQFETQSLYVYIPHVTEVNEGAKTRNRLNQVPHLTQDTNGKVTNSQIDITNEGQEVSPFPAGDRKAHINRRAQANNKHI